MRSYRNNGKSLWKLLIIIVAIVGAVSKFLIEVNKRGLWKECIISVGVFAGTNFIMYIISEYTEDLKYLVLSVAVTSIIFCVYWSVLFNTNPYTKFSKSKVKVNSKYWKEAQWWWALDGWQFEEEVAKIFTTYGYKAVVTKGSGDGGVDIILEKGGYRSIVQCKHYKNPVPPEPVRALWGCKDDFNADEVILVASSGVTESSAKYISNKPNFKILTLEDIVGMANKGEHV